MRFAAPQFLWLLAVLPAVAAAAWAARSSRARALRSFAGGAPHVGRFTEHVSGNRRAVKLLLLCLALGAIAVALARPQWGTSLQTITRTGSDVVIVLDTSLSMAAEDLAPSRLEHAKHSIASLLDRLEGHRVGLVTFAGQATLACPLTVDHGAVRLFLESSDVRSVPLPGTALADALGLALRSLASGAAADRGRAVVVYSDGEDHEGGIDEIVEQYARSAIAVHAVGCGTTRGAPIPLRDPSGALSGYKKDGEDRVVTSRVDEDVLERIALGTDGRYFRATAGEVEVERIATALSGLESGALGSELRASYEERFQIPLVVGWLALVAETLLGDRRRATAGRRGGGT